MIPKSVKRGGLHRLAVALMVMATLLVVSVGCDDHNSEQAKMEDARIAIDNGQYENAIELLSSLGGKEVLELRSSAYAGKAGLNVLKVIEDFDDSSETNGLDIVGKMLGGKDHPLTENQVDKKLEAMYQAKDSLIASADDELENLDDGGRTQLAICSLTDSALVLGQIISKSYGDELPNSGAVTLSEDWLKDNVKPIATPDGGQAYDNLETQTEQLNRLSDNIYNIGFYIDNLTKDSDLKEEFEEFRHDIGGDDDEISNGDLKKYLREL